MRSALIPILLRSLDASTKTIIAAMTVKPSQARSFQIDALVRALKAAGCWDSLDYLYVLAAADQQSALLNWKNPGTFNATITGAGTFTADRGWQGDGSTGYLNTGFAANAAPSPNFLPNSAHVGLWSRTSGSSGSASESDFGDHDTTNRLYFTIKTTGNLLGYRPNSGSTGAVAAPANASGHFLMDISVNAQSFYQNGASFATDTLTTGVATSGQTIGATHVDGTAKFSSRQFAAAHVGAALGAAKTRAMFAALNSYMTAVGAA